MPYVKNEEGKICLALEPEVTGLLAAGFKLLDAAEEAEHRQVLEANQELTSHPAQEKARIEAGVYEVPGIATGTAAQTEASTVASGGTGIAQSEAAPVNDSAEADPSTATASESRDQALPADSSQPVDSSTVSSSPAASDANPLPANEQPVGEGKTGAPIGTADANAATATTETPVETETPANDTAEAAADKATAGAEASDGTDVNNPNGTTPPSATEPGNSTDEQTDVPAAS